MVPYSYCWSLLTHSICSMALFINTGSIVHLGIFISKFKGENFIDNNKPKNEFDQLFMIDYSSLTLIVGILAGLMWVPFSWIVKHWIGLLHAITPTMVVITLWYEFLAHQFLAIPFAIVVIYIFTIFVLKNRKKSLSKASHLL